MAAERSFYLRIHREDDGCLCTDGFGVDPPAMGAYRFYMGGELGLFWQYCQAPTQKTLGMRRLFSHQPVIEMLLTETQWDALERCLEVRNSNSRKGPDTTRADEEALILAENDVSRLLASILVTLYDGGYGK